MPTTPWSLQIIVFDFDGVLVDSNQIKWDAFFQVLGPEHRARTLRALARGRELPRRVLFSRILADVGLRGRELEREVERHARLYSRHVTTAIVARGLFPWTLPVLRHLAPRYPLYVASTTPQRELQALLRRLGVAPLLRSAFGWPTSKVDAVRRVAAARARRQILIVGDGRSDRRAAIATGCRFVGITNRFNGWVVNPSGNQIRSLRELPALLERRGVRLSA